MQFTEVLQLETNQKKMATYLQYIVDPQPNSSLCMTCLGYELNVVFTGSGAHLKVSQFPPIKINFQFFPDIATCCFDKWIPCCSSLKALYQPKQPISAVKCYRNPCVLSASLRLMNQCNFFLTHSTEIFNCINCIQLFRLHFYLGFRKGTPWQLNFLAPCTLWPPHFLVCCPPLWCRCGTTIIVLVRPTMTLSVVWIGSVGHMATLRLFASLKTCQVILY